MRVLSLADFLSGPATRGPRLRSSRAGPGGRLKHAPKYRRPGDSPVMQTWEAPVRVNLALFGVCALRLISAACCV